MDKDRPHISEPVFRAFLRTFGLARGRMEVHFARFGISASQWGVLRTLHRAHGTGQDALRLTDLHRHLLIKPPSVTGIVDRLERAGLVARRASSTDLRAKEVHLTPAGQALVTRVLVHHPARIRAVLAGLSDAEQRTLLPLMERLAAHLEAMEARETPQTNDAPRTTKRRGSKQ